jgi:hypothetical protein
VNNIDCDIDNISTFEHQSSNIMSYKVKVKGLKSEAKNKKTEAEAKPMIMLVSKSFYTSLISF